MLEKIQKPNDIKKIPADQLPALAEEIREFIIESLSKTGGHLASNLGVVELTIAMHRVFDLPKDKLIWDVGHQSYTHKILTGRKDGFETLRREGGISGFPKRSESDCDVFDTGHSSTSISAGVGYVRARELKKENYSVVSIIGDGALTGGMAYEALNNAASLKSNFIIVLNDNDHRECRRYVIVPVRPSDGIGVHGFQDGRHKGIEPHSGHRTWHGGCDAEDEKQHQTDHHSGHAV